MILNLSVWLKTRGSIGSTYPRINAKVQSTTTKKFKKIRESVVNNCIKLLNLLHLRKRNKASKDIQMTSGTFFVCSNLGTGFDKLVIICLIL